MVVVLGALALVQTMRLARQRSRSARRMARHRRQGAAGEEAALRMLQTEGYRIVARHPRGSWTVWVDGAPVEIELCPDFHVEKHGRRYVADAKTGKSASIEHAATRRQLLEYREAFDVDGVLLVGPQGVEHIELGRRDPRRRSIALVILAVAVVVIALAWVALTQHEQHRRHDDRHQQAHDARVPDDVLGLEAHDPEQG